MGCLVRYPTSKLLEVDGRGKSVLHLAAKQGNHEVVDYILKEAPVLLDFHNQTQETPLLIAAAFGHFKLVEKFLQGPQTETLRRALHRDVNGTSCLMAALARNDNDIALYLLRRFGRKLATLPNEVNMMPIHIAASKGNLEFLRIVVKFDHTMVNHQDVYGCTPCVYAVQGGSLASLRYLVEKAKANIGCLTSKGQSLLHVAALSSQFNMCRWLVQKMGSQAILWQTLDNANTIHCASFSGNVPSLRLLMEPWSKRKRKLILSQRDSRGNTPLHLAVINGHFNSAQCLLEFGSNLFLENNKKQTPLAVAQLRNNPKMIRLLEEHITDKRPKSKKSRSYADLAVPSSNVIGEKIGFSSSECASSANGHPLKSVGSFLLNMNLQKMNEISTQTDQAQYWDEAWAAVSELDQVLAAHSR
ncbi:unnamed protein product [Bursaphelenchus xylophilus]|uniref:(pine wood nematode) hypothetical protein n=1 Tax=Bursaphelenchus xylophilus TaxID=6326 RepID=A0A1I7S3K0_BURXY|nr:unnamed protein product [Bursaphelenchus xylophilus]CAG9116364.1 unnamed protein product [Bursaphelenchus xylophilus]